MRNLSKELKQQIFKLLREDEEFRYSVAGLIGLDEILKRLDRNERQLIKLREDMLKGFERHDAILEKHSAEIARLREDMLKGFERHDAILEKHSAEIARLREDMLKGFELIRRHIDALGARWGIMSEKAFREGLKGLLKEELGLEVEKWIYRDEKGIVYGYPSIVDIDVAIHDGKVILIEIASHVRRSDVITFKRKADLYEKVTGKRPERLLIVTPYAEEKARRACAKLGIELYTKV